MCKDRPGPSIVLGGLGVVWWVEAKVFFQKKNVFFITAGVGKKAIQVCRPSQYASLCVCVVEIFFFCIPGRLFRSSRSPLVILKNQFRVSDLITDLRQHRRTVDN